MRWLPLPGKKWRDRMPTDLELIKKLEREIGRNLDKREFQNIEMYSQQGFAINDNENVIGLNLDEIRLAPLPVTLSKFQNLEKLRLYRTEIRDISFIQDFGHLTSLDLRDNKITNISFIQGLTHLRSLCLSVNKIIDISSLQYLSNLTTLDLGFNKIIDISVLKSLTHLTSLDLQYNEITDISFLKDLTHLTCLNLKNNKITEISFLKGLNNLSTLNLSNNRISELPIEIVKMRMEANLDSDEGTGAIFLKGNPIEKPPIEIVRKGKGAIKIYYQSLEGEKRALNEVKVLLVGEGGAGKTSLLKRLLGQTVDKYESQTHGINISHKWELTSEKILKIHIWDFGGQEIMHAIHQFFLSKRSLYVLVLDGRKDEKTEYWLKHIQSFGGDSSVLVVINKIDENPTFDVNRSFLQEKYKNIKGFFRVSCATGEGIESFSEQLTYELEKVELIHTTWSNKWFRVKIQLEKMTEYFINYGEYKTLCENECIEDKVSQDTLVEYLNDLGVILHFKDFELQDTYVLDPKWVTTAVYGIINSPKLAETSGLLKLSMLEQILNKEHISNYYYPSDKHKYIIHLMEKFELCYRINDETVMIPDLLPAPEPSFDFDNNDALKFIIQYDFLPRSIMPRFIVNMHKDIKADLRWRTGVVIEDKDFDSTAVIKADDEAKRIYIYVNGGQRRDYFAAILKILRRINQSFEKLKTKELIPMPDDPDITVNYKHLIRLEQEGLEYYLPGESEKKYKVKDLLGSYGDVIKDDTMRILKEIKMYQLKEESKEEESP
jgi:small GTP-binding protein